MSSLNKGGRVEIPPGFEDKRVSLGPDGKPQVESIDHISSVVPTNGTTDVRALIEIKTGNAGLTSNQKIVYA
ncbi:MAG TPA: hypothetical protein VIZ65_12125 [Cellvibrionaceae bacterium]